MVEVSLGMLACLLLEKRGWNNNAYEANRILEILDLYVQRDKLVWTLVKTAIRRHERSPR